MQEGVAEEDEEEEEEAAGGVEEGDGVEGSDRTVDSLSEFI